MSSSLTAYACLRYSSAAISRVGNAGRPVVFVNYGLNPWLAYAVMLAAVGSIAFAIAGVQGLAALK
ncbi:hypothetical protein J7E62_29775 [Variovorax paradoxus]|nr:hypothetical protein [Variovorax paradoxus]